MTWSVQSGKTLHVESGVIEKSLAPIEEKPCQTDTLATRTVILQVGKQSENTTQTEPQILPAAKPTIDWKGLLDFLKRAERLVSKELIKNVQSVAFQNVDEPIEKCENNSISKLFTLKHVKESGRNISQLSWNSKGTLIAASWTHSNHESWCAHKGLLCIWWMGLETNSKNATLTIETTGCLSQISFHQEIPGLLAGATMTGEVMLWNITEEAIQPIARTSMLHLGHSEEVTCLQWNPNTQGDVDLFTSSMDGKIFGWSMSNKLQYPIVGCQLNMSMVQHSIRVKGNLPLGITAFSLSPDGMEMVIGTQSGHLFKCSSELKRSPKSPNDLILFNPNTYSFQRLSQSIKNIYHVGHSFFLVNEHSGLYLFKRHHPRPIWLMEGYLCDSIEPISESKWMCLGSEGSQLLDIVMDQVCHEFPQHLCSAYCPKKQFMAMASPNNHIDIYTLSDNLNLNLKEKFNN